MRLVTATQLGLVYGDLEVFSGVDVEADSGCRVGLVGPNGSGKTSLLKVLLGESEPSAGAVSVSKGLRIGYVPQSPPTSTRSTLRDQVMDGLARLRQVENDMARAALDIQQLEDRERREAERRYARRLQEFEALGGHDYESRIERVASGLGLHPATLDVPAGSASGGQRTRAALAAALLSDPDLLVLDEPTNYLDFDGLVWLESFLSRGGQDFIVVSHDRYFLDKVVTEIWELDHGSLHAFKGNYTRYRALKAERDRRQQLEYERQQELIAREEAFIRRYGAGQRAGEARGRARRLERLERLEAPDSDSQIRVRTFGSQRTGLAVVTLQGVSVGYEDDGERKVVLETPDLELERRSRAAIIGANGAGKTTLVRTIVGEQPPLRGRSTLGHGVNVGYYTQGSVDLPKDSTVLDAFMDVAGMTVPEARSYLARFLFQGDDVFSPIPTLSGGEKSRLALARLIIARPNFLVLDEPTTHLDIAGREALEQALLDFDGCILFVSHDRRLISRLADQVWSVEDGQMKVTRGGFEEWQLGRQAAPSAPQTKAGAPAKRRPAAAAKKPAGAPARDHEKIISEAEEHLERLEREIEEASARQDLGAITRLGVEYESAKARLEQAWAEWGS